MQPEKNEDMKAVVAAVESLVSASSLLARAVIDPERRAYVDLAFDTINTTASTLQLILTISNSQRPRQKPVLRVVK